MIENTKQKREKREMGNAIFGTTTLDDEAPKVEEALEKRMKPVFVIMWEAWLAAIHEKVLKSLGSTRFLFHDFEIERFMWKRLISDPRLRSFYEVAVASWYNQIGLRDITSFNDVDAWNGYQFSNKRIRHFNDVEITEKDDKKPMRSKEKKADGVPEEEKSSAKSDETPKTQTDDDDDKKTINVKVSIEFTNSTIAFTNDAITNACSYHLNTFLWFLWNWPEHRHSTGTKQMLHLKEDEVFITLQVGLLNEVIIKDPVKSYFDAHDSTEKDQAMSMVQSGISHVQRTHEMNNIAATLSPPSFDTMSNRGHQLTTSQHSEYAQITHDNKIKALERLLSKIDTIMPGQNDHLAKRDRVVDPLSNLMPIQPASKYAAMGKNMLPTVLGGSVFLSEYRIPFREAVMKGYWIFCLNDDKSVKIEPNVSKSSQILQDIRLRQMKSTTGAWFQLLENESKNMDAQQKAQEEYLLHMNKENIVDGDRSGDDATSVKEQKKLPSYFYVPLTSVIFIDSLMSQNITNEKEISKIADFFNDHVLIQNSPLWVGDLYSFYVATYGIPLEEKPAIYHLTETGIRYNRIPTINDLNDDQTNPYKEAFDLRAEVEAQVLSTPLFATKTKLMDSDSESSSDSGSSSDDDDNESSSDSENSSRSSSGSDEYEKEENNGGTAKEEEEEKKKIQKKKEVPIEIQQSFMEDIGVQLIQTIFRRNVLNQQQAGSLSWFRDSSQSSSLSNVLLLNADNGSDVPYGLRWTTNNSTQSNAINRNHTPDPILDNMSIERFLGLVADRLASPELLTMGNNIHTSVMMMNPNITQQQRQEQYEQQQKNRGYEHLLQSNKEGLTTMSPIYMKRLISVDLLRTMLVRQSFACMGSFQTPFLNILEKIQLFVLRRFVFTRGQQNSKNGKWICVPGCELPFIHFVKKSQLMMGHREVAKWQSKERILHFVLAFVHSVTLLLVFQQLLTIKCTIADTLNLQPLSFKKDLVSTIHLFQFQLSFLLRQALLQHFWVNNCFEMLNELKFLHVSKASESVVEACVHNFHTKLVSSIYPLIHL